MHTRSLELHTSPINLFRINIWISINFNKAICIICFYTFSQSRKEASYKVISDIKFILVFIKIRFTFCIAVKGKQVIIIIYFRTCQCNSVKVKLILNAIAFNYCNSVVFSFNCTAHFFNYPDKRNNRISVRMNFNSYIFTFFIVYNKLAVFPI